MFSIIFLVINEQVKSVKQFISNITHSVVCICLFTQPYRKWLGEFEKQASQSTCDSHEVSNC